jgi:prepilin-type N-terminal cleavage/methylation domain-containing protein
MSLFHSIQAWRSKVGIRTRHETSRRGFTLMEVLTVLTIMAVLAAVSLPAVSSFTSAGRTNQALASLAGEFAIAREYAVTQNTFVWVAFSSWTNSTGQKELSVAVVGSQDGTDPASGSSGWTQFSYGTVPAQGLGLVSKIITIPQLELANAGSFTTTQIPSLPTVTPAVSSSSNSMPSSSSSFFSMNVPGTGPQTFTQAVEFLPDGEARNGAGTINVVEIDVQPLRGGSSLPDNKNVAAVRINGLTCEATIYRP